MQYFLGIVPPKDIIQKILKFQQQWRNNLLIEAVEPHITVKAQGGLDTNEIWLNAVKKVCESFLRFEITLNKPKFFGDSVLYLSVDSKIIHDLHNKIVEAVSPAKELIKKYLELEDYVPHLTLGQTSFGLTTNELIDMAHKVEIEFNSYPTFKVDFIRVYREVEPNKYTKYVDIPLK